MALSLIDAQNRLRAGRRAEDTANAQSVNRLLDTVKQKRQNALSKAVGGQLAQNDLAGARNTAFKKGALDVGFGIDEMQRGRAQAGQEAQQAALQEFGTAAGQILSLPPEQQEAAYMQLLPQLRETAKRYNIPFNDDGVFDDRDRAAMQALAARTGNLPQSRAEGDNIGTYNPRDYTTESWARFLQTKDPSVLERYEPLKYLDVGTGYVPASRVPGRHRRGRSGGASGIITKSGSPSKDQVVEQTEEGPVARPLPGSKEERRRRKEDVAERRQRLTKERMQKHAGRTVLRSVTRSLDNFLPKINQGEGIIGASDRMAQAQIPGTDEWKLNRQVKDFSRNIGLDRLQQMREASPTGGALGQVPVRQQQMLQEVLGSFDIGQDPEILEENLKQLNNIYLDIMFGTPEEREFLMEEGKLTPQENRVIDSHYYDTEFDVFGRRDEGSPEEQGGGQPDQSQPQPALNIPEPAIQFLMENPGTADQFDEKFGEGASQRILEGR